MAPLTPSLLVRLRRPEHATPIFPFGEPPAELPLLDVPLARFQEREAASLGLRVVDVGEDDALPPGTRALVADDVVFNAAALRALLAVAEARGGAWQAAVAPSAALYDFVAPFLTDAAPASAARADLPMPLVAGDLAGQRAAHVLASAPRHPICDETESDVVRVAPQGPPPHELRVPRVSRVVGRISHWLHLLNLNHALLVSERHRRGAVGEANVIEGRVRCHPSAYVAGSILHDGVEIEHEASVIDSFLGEGVKIGDHALFHSCVIGRGCHTLIDTHMRRVVALPGSTLSNLGLEDLLIGREVFITTAVAFFREAPGGNVMLEGQDSRRPCLSGAIGHRCVLGARALFAAGAAIPAGTLIVMRPDEGLAKLDERGLSRASMRLGDRHDDV